MAQLTLTSVVPDKGPLNGYVVVVVVYLFNGPLSGTTRVSWYQKGKTNLDFTGARDSEWQWQGMCKMKIFCCHYHPLS